MTYAKCHPIYLFALLGLSATLGLPLHAQSHVSLNPSKALTQYVHAAWTTDEGLPQNTVGTIVQTQDGYLWIGTEEGLVRFDGVRFTLFDKRNTAAFEDSHTIQALFEDEGGTLWIGTRGGGLFYTKEGHITPFTASGFTGKAVSTLYQDRSGVLWIGTFDAGLFAYQDGRVSHYTIEEGLSSNLVSVIYEDHAGILWVGTDEGLNQVESGRISSFSSNNELANTFITALLEDQQNNLWVGTRGGLHRHKDGVLIPMETQTAPGGTGVRAFWEDAVGTLWIGTENGLIRHRPNQIDAFTRSEGLTHDRVLSLYGDREGNLWIGTEGGGLNRLSDSKFTPYGIPEQLSHDMVLTVYEDNEGAIWIGTEGGGLNRLQNGEITTITSQDGLSNDVITSLSGDDAGTLWIGTLGGGLNRMTANGITTVTTQAGLPSNAVFALHTASDGSLWIGTDAGLASLKNNSVTTYTTAEGLSSDFVAAIHQDRQGDLWIGTYDGGLNRLRNGHFTTYTTDDGLGSDLVLALHEDQDGTFWVGTYEGGLSRFKDGTITTYTTKAGLFDDKIYRILEDGQGNLWMSSNRGIFRVAKAELNAFAGGKTDHITSVAYSKKDGLRSTESNGGVQPAGWKSRDGKLWFPTVKGIAMIDPAHLQYQNQAPTVVLEDIVVDNHPVGEATLEELDPGIEIIAFHYTALSFVAPKAIRFRYILKGYNSDWQEAGPSRVATYTNLDPGPYTFQVIAQNSDGVWNETGASVSFYLKPHFYQQSWFYVLCVLALFLLGFIGYQLRIRHLKARRRELESVIDERTHDLRAAKEKIETQANELRELDRFKTRFFANVSHEFRTPLTMIVGPLENALQGNYGVLEPPVRRQVEIMLRNALRLSRLINQLLDLSKLEAGKMRLRACPRNVVQFVEGIVFTCTAYAEQKGLSLKFSTQLEELALYYEPDKLEKVIFNLLSNSLKHTSAGGEIRVSLSDLPAVRSAEAREGCVEIRVRDTGTGIPKEELPFIFDRFHQVDGSSAREHEGTGIGLSLVKELILLHKGTIEVESEVGKGTTFTVRLPKGKSHLKQEEIALTGEGEVIAPEYGAITELAAEMPLPRRDAPGLHAQQPSLPEEAPLVLIVDDNPDVREYVSTTLGDTYRIAMAENGLEGLEKAEILHPDLIVSDVMMPHMDGNMFCKHIKEHADLHLTPVILLTARATHELKMEGLQVRADDYMAKPFNARELKVRIQNLIQLHDQERELRLLNDGLEQKVQEHLKVILAERERYEAELVDARDKAEASSRLKSAILNNMSHELRTPLTAIHGSAQILALEVDADLQEFADNIMKGGERLTETLDAIIELARLEANDLTPSTQAVNLVEVARQTCRQFSNAASTEGLMLRLETPSEGPVLATLDLPATKRVLGHLIDNAIKFTEAGEIVLTVRRVGEVAQLSVRDTGIGISVSFQPKVFEAFAQESSGLARLHQGMGLGLTIAQRLTELMGGSIVVESEQGNGSVFSMQVPCTSESTERGPIRKATGEDRNGITSVA